MNRWTARARGAAGKFFGSLRRLPSQFRQLEARIWTMPDDASHGIRAHGQRWLQVLDRSFRNFLANDSLNKSSTLTYTTFLTFIPLLAIILALLKGFNLLESTQEAIRRSAHQMLAATGATMAAHERIIELIDQIFLLVGTAQFTALGPFAVVGLTVTVLTLMSRIEAVMNDAWAVHKSRPLARKLSDYMTLILVLTLLLVATTVTTRTSIVTFEGLLARFNSLQAILLSFTPYLIIWIALIFMFFYIPNTRVAWKSAIIAGLLAGLLFHVNQLLFLHLSATFIDRYRAIYGGLGVIFFLLIWVWVAWCIVLWGVEVCSTHQNLRDWRRRRRPWRNTPAERETLALRLAALLAGPMLNLESERAPLDTGQLADELKLPPQPVAEMLELFEGQGLVRRADDGSYLLARVPDCISALDILRLVRHGRNRPLPPADDHLRGLTEQVSAGLASQSIRDLAALQLEEIHTFNY